MSYSRERVKTAVLSQYILETYWFDHNLQGDIIGIYSKTGTKLASYVYDAWGNFTVTYSNGGESLSAVVNNPFRYRGYYYDVDLGLYYLQSRYYDANTGRFISPDDITYLGANGDLNSYNLYAYCSNNPVMYADPSGHASKWWQWLISGLEVTLGMALCFVPGLQDYGVTLIGTGAGSIINGYITESNGGSFTAGWAGGQVSGFVSAIPGVGIPLGAFFGSVTTDSIDIGWGGIDWSKAVYSSFVAWGVSLFPGIVGETLSKFKINDKANYFINAYNTILTSVANSIVNVYWRGKSSGK